MTRLLKAQEVADRLSVDPTTVYRWAWEKKIPSVKLPGKVLRFDPEALDEWLKEKS